VVRPIRQAQSSTEAHSKSSPEALEGQAHQVSKGEKRQLFPLAEHGDSNPVFEIICSEVLPCVESDNLQYDLRREIKVVQIQPLFDGMDLAHPCG